MKLFFIFTTLGVLGWSTIAVAADAVNWEGSHTNQSSTNFPFKFDKKPIGSEERNSPAKQSEQILLNAFLDTLEEHVDDIEFPLEVMDEAFDKNYRPEDIITAIKHFNKAIETAKSDFVEKLPQYHWVQLEQHRTIKLYSRYNRHLNSGSLRNDRLERKFGNNADIKQVISDSQHIIADCLFIEFDKLLPVQHSEKKTYSDSRTNAEENSKAQEKDK